MVEHSRKTECEAERSDRPIVETTAIRWAVPGQRQALQPAVSVAGHRPVIASHSRQPVGAVRVPPIRQRRRAPGHFGGRDHGTHPTVCRRVLLQVFAAVEVFVVVDFSPCVAFVKDE